MTEKIVQILDLLVSTYGNRKLKPHQDPIGELVQTILSQNTSDFNSRPAFRSLKAAFNSWDDVIRADPVSIAETIKRGGMGQIKTVRIQKALTEIKHKKGKLTLNFLKNWPVDEARKWLLLLPGVGAKTANCILLFSFGLPAFPVDTHIFRISKRLGLIGEKTNLPDAHLLLEKIIPTEHVYELHVLMIEHGRKTCLARNPRCSSCVLVTICPRISIPAAELTILEKVKR
jgi:endonuclease III